MQDKPYRVLFTRKLPDDLIKYGADLNLDIDAREFICVKHRELDPSIQELLKDENYPNWVFSSQNAVKILHPWVKSLDPLTQRNCFAVGEKTAQKVAQLGFMSLVPEQQDSEHLVMLLEKEKPEGAFIYFSGNIRRNTITTYFSDNNIDYREVVVYDTYLTQPEVEISNYDAICFCSPSAVKSFFSKYSTEPEIPCIAIGNVTACALVEHSDNVLTTETPSLHALIDTCNKHLNYNK